MGSSDTDRAAPGRSGYFLGAEVLPDQTLLAVVGIDFRVLHDEVGVVLIHQAQVEMLAVAYGQGYLVGELRIKIGVSFRICIRVC